MLKMKVRPEVGLVAAELAAAIGKVQRGRALPEKGQQQLALAESAATVTCEMLDGSISYWEYRNSSNTYKRMWEMALTEGAVESKDKLQALALMLNHASADLADRQELTELHDLFAHLADVVNASLTSAGEVLNY